MKNARMHQHYVLLLHCGKTQENKTKMYYTALSTSFYTFNLFLCPNMIVFLFKNIKRKYSLVKNGSKWVEIKQG